MTEYKPPVKSMRMLHVNLSDTFSIVNMLKVSKHTSCDNMVVVTLHLDL